MKYLNKFVEIFTGLVYVIVMPMTRIAKKHPIAFGFAVVIHIALVVGLFYANVERWEMPEQAAGAERTVPTKAITIDLKEIKAEQQRLVDLEQQKQDKLESEIRQSEAAKKAQKQAEERRDKAKEAALTAEEQKQLADKEREITEAEAAEAYRKKVQAEAEALTAEEKTQLADEERKKKEAEAAQAEVKAKEAEAKAKEAEEAEELAKHLTEEERKKKEQLEKERAVEQDAFEKDQEVRSLTQEIQAEEDQERELVIEDQFSKLKSSYIGLIAARVKDQWRYMGAEDDWGCDVYIIQDEDGYVEAVNVQDCTIDESAQAASFRNSIERAVYKASPLPLAPDQSVFDTEIMFHFRVN
ncbi:MAG: cell envelope integrity protein TolA [Gammaproteobacteria bacterium]|nr:cell envelope integrity protein TolA [Gammaproteobacteria bacterium]